MGATALTPNQSTPGWLCRRQTWHVLKQTQLAFLNVFFFPPKMSVLLTTSSQRPNDNPRSGNTSLLPFKRRPKCRAVANPHWYGHRWYNRAVVCKKNKKNNNNKYKIQKGEEEKEKGNKKQWKDKEEKEKEKKKENRNEKRKKKKKGKKWKREIEREKWKGEEGNRTNYLRYPTKYWKKWQFRFWKCKIFLSLLAPLART